ncbi:MAG: zf-HC2 domain-containing protein [Planctomycetota bacterium]|nr:zf-HC2 domain-containing protein [Planctomycetota bacterium]
MACEEKIQEDLVALIQHELSSDREAAVHKHLEGCASCRDEYEQFRSVFKAAKRINLVEPSAVFRKNLERRISEAIEHSKRSQLQKRPGSTGVRLPNVAPTVENTSSTKRIAPVAPPESAATRVTARLNSTRRPEPRGPWLRYVAFAAACVVLALTASHFVFFPKGGDNSDPAEQMRIAAEKRWNERRAGQNWEKILAENAVPMPDDMALTEAVYVLPHSVPSFHEKCVVAYTQADRERLEANAKKPAQREEIRKLFDGAVKVNVEGGKLAVTPDMVTRYLGGSNNRVVILKLNGRMEIWSASAFERYRNATPVLETVPAAAPSESGVPTESDAHGATRPAA